MTMATRVADIRAGDRRAIAALMRDLEDDRPQATETLQALQSGAEGALESRTGADSVTGRSVVGVTGGPGAGKSTLVDGLIAHWRAAGLRVGVVAVDPSSPLGGGAVLGDRVRMQRHATDPGVFIRSVASRGALGGLARAASQVAAVLGAAGFSRVILETVGAGQAEVDVASAADVTLVVVTPGLGDEVQMLKAGILEIADILVLNKADRPGAESALRDLQAMLSVRGAAALPAGAGPPSEHVAPGAPATGDPPAAGTRVSTGTATNNDNPVSARSDVPIVQTVATKGVGVPALAAAVDQAIARPKPVRQAGLRRRAEARIRAIVAARIDAAARAALAPGAEAAGLAEDVAALRLDAESAADALMARLRERY